MIRFNLPGYGPSPYDRMETVNPDYQCLACTSYFASGYSIDGDHFCDECHKEHRHIGYYRKHNLTDKEINQLLESYPTRKL